MSRLVQNQVSKVELQNAVQAWREIMKKRVELSCEAITSEISSRAWY